MPSAFSTGFGWHDITAEKVGFAFKASPKVTLRAGYNSLGPAVRCQPDFLQSARARPGRHGGKEINVAYQHAFQRTLNGVNSIPAAFGGGEASLSMYRNSVGASFGWWEVD